MKIVVSSSGGVDSSLVMLLLKADGHEVFPVHVNYGHLAEPREWEACQAICKRLGVSAPVRFSINGTEAIPSGLVHPELDIEKQAFFPTRNLLFATLASAYAYSIGGRVVALGILANPIFPDQSVSFFQLAEKCISASLGVELRILTPFITLDKREVLKLARARGLPFEITYYCHSGKSSPCGICISCKERIAAEKMLAEESR